MPNKLLSNLWFQKSMFIIINDCIFFLRILSICKRLQTLTNRIKPEWCYVRFAKDFQASTYRKVMLYNFSCVHLFAVCRFTVGGAFIILKCASILHLKLKPALSFIFIFIYVYARKVGHIPEGFKRNSVILKM